MKGIIKMINIKNVGIERLAKIAEKEYLKQISNGNFDFTRSDAYIYALEEVDVDDYTKEEDIYFESEVTKLLPNISKPRTNQEWREFYGEYLSHDVKKVIDDAYSAVNEYFKDNSVSVAYDDRAERFIGAITEYIIESKRP
jgi:hypothetical protein